MRPLQLLGAVLVGAAAYALATWAVLVFLAWWWV